MPIRLALVLCAVLASALPAGLRAQEGAGEPASGRQACPRPERVMPHHSPEMLRRELERFQAEQAWTRGGPPPRGAPLAGVDPDSAGARYRRATTAYRVGMAHVLRECRYVPNLILALSVSPHDSASSATVMLDVVYYYTGDHGSEVSIGAITKLQGTSTGHWAYRPVRLSPGLRTARIRLGMNRSAPDVYRSDGIEVEMYVHRGSTFTERLFVVDRTWRRER